MGFKEWVSIHAMKIVEISRISLSSSNVQNSTSPLLHHRKKECLTPAALKQRGSGTLWCFNELNSFVGFAVDAG
jgi:hypothetical protein